MIGLIFLYSVWKKYSELAVKYQKSKHYGWLGILGYVLGLLMFGVLLGILDQIFGWGIDWERNTVVRFLDIPVGLLICYVLYIILERKWKSECQVIDTIDDIGKEKTEV